MNTDKTTGNEFSDPFDTAGQVPPEIVANPYPTYRRMHERGPIHYYKSLDVWSLIGYEDISNAFRDKRLSADRISVYDSKLPDSMKESMAPVLNIFSNTMLFSDGADHTRLRSLANKARAGFIDAPDTGPPRRAPSATVPPTAIPAIMPFSLAPVDMPRITNIRNAVRSTSSRKD